MTYRVRPADLIVFDGQSLNLVPNAAQSFPTKTMATGITHTAWYNAAITATSWTQRAVDAAERVDKRLRSVPTTGICTLFDTAGTRNIAALNQDAATAFAEAAAYWADRRTAGFDLIVASTLAPSTSFVGDEPAEMAAFNNLLRAAVGDEIDALADWDTIPEATDATNTTYFPDGTHLSDALTTLIAPVTRAAYLAARATV